MKIKLLSLLFLSASLFVISCGSDPECTAESVAGTYVGTNDCDPDDVTENTLVVTASGESVTFTNEEEGSSWTVALNECSTEPYTETVDIFGISITTTINATFTDSNVTLATSASGFGIDDTCTLVFTKQ